LKRPVFLLFTCITLILLPGCRKSEVVAPKTVVEITMSEVAVDGSGTEYTPIRKTAEVLIGFQQTSPVIENALLGMRVGETKKIRLKASEGPYGGYNAYAVQVILKSMLPAGQEVLAAPTSARITAVDNDSVTVDFNHPFAGKDLLIGIEVRKIRAATKEELDRVLSTGQEYFPP
jgi:FKBP-type peptidyl-prolyl cis-trans isomerase 2